MNKDIMRYNKARLNDLSKKIMDCNGDYRLFCIDVDDVVYNIAPLMQDILAEIDFRATNDYRVKIASQAPSDSQDASTMSYTILDAILEERSCIVKKENGQVQILDFSNPIIDYEELYSEKNLFPNAYEFINMLIQGKRENDFIIFLSHRNPEREAVVKTRKLYELFPQIDGIITLPFHEQIGAKMSDKGLCCKQTLLLENLDNCILIDNTKRNCTNWRDGNGIAIRYLPEGFDKCHTLADHMSKLISLDPFMISLCLNFIEYSRNNPDYFNQFDVPYKVKSLKK